MLEYSQRLKLRARNVIASAGESNGARLYGDACVGGAQAMGRKIGAIAPGCRADIVTLDDTHPDMADGTATALDKYIFVAGSALVKNVMVGGDLVVTDGTHKRRDPITMRYRKTMEKLLA
jgi:cytosine/adenosine deaminase-related metal-dependent hydrolase